MKRIYETPAGRALSAWAIIKDGKPVASVRAHYGQSRVTVEVSCDKGHTVQQGKASGSGYDRFTAALAGLTIDGHVMADHCGDRLPYPDGLDYFPAGFVPPVGYRTANSRYSGGYRSCYKEAGLKYLEALGYTVFQVL